MPANLRRTFTLTEPHDELIKFIVKNMNVDASNANRIIYDCVLDNSPDIVVHTLERERRMKKLELKDLDKRISSAKKSMHDNPINRLIQPKKSESSDVRSIDTMSPDETIENYLPDISKDTGTGRLARARIQAVLLKHPEKLSGLPKEVRESFKSGGER